MRHRPPLRRSLLLDSSRKRRISRKTRVRNKFLNIFAGFSGLKNLKNIFRWSVLAGLIFTGMAGFLLFAIFSPYYELKKISVVRNNETIPAEVVQNISSKFLGKNMFFLRKEEIKNLLREKFPEINKIEITDKWPSEIEINLELSPAKYTIFDEKSANFASITASGIVISENSTDGLPVIKVLQYDKPLKVHTRFVSADWLEKINLAEELLREEIKLPIREIRLLMKAREVHFVTNNDSVIWIDLEQSIPQQIKKLVLAEGKIKLYSKQFTHIDLRIPKQIFWEWR